MKRIKVAFLNWNENGTIAARGYKCDVEGSTLYQILKKNYELEISENPDFTFVSAQFNEPIKYPDSVRILYSSENHKPNFNVFDYAITVFKNMQYENRCFYLDSNLYFDNYFAYEAALSKHENSDFEVKKKTGFCSFVVSNGGSGSSRRKQIFDLLSQYKKVDSGGSFLNNVGGPIKNKIQFCENRKFSITFENSFGYVTEKIQEGFAAKTVPIYWGGAYVNEIYNPKAFINCHDFSSFEEAVEYVKKVDQDDELYLQMLKEPAFLESKSTKQYLEELERFLIEIIETPKAMAMQRDPVNQQGTLEKIYYYGYEQYIKLHNTPCKDFNWKRFWKVLLQDKLIGTLKRVINGLFK